MLRTLTVVLGAVTALFPDGIVALFERLAIGNPGESTQRAWVTPAIRSEGILIAIISLVGGRSYAWLTNLTGAFGALVLVSPDLYRKFASALLYERPDSVDWNERFTTVVRAIGAVYLVLAARAYRNRRKGT
jgi:hypothetical protein